MDNRIVAVAAAAVVAGAIAGCSSSPTESPRPAGSLAPGTGQATVGGKGIAVTDRVSCPQVGQAHTIEIGDDNSNAQVIVSSANNEWSVNSVVLNNVGGFTGSFWSGRAGKADVKLVGMTYTVTGTATGVHADKPTQTTDGKFEIKANC